MSQTQPLRLYDQLAALWPLLSPPEDYAPEARLVHRTLRAALGAGERGKRRTLIEFGAGGGHALFHLKKHYDVTALDVSPQMLEQSRKLNPDIDHVVGDMRDARLGRTFDAVLIHDAVDYMTSVRDVQRALRTAQVHLRPGGVLLVAPTYTAETFEPQSIADENSDGKQHVSFISQVRQIARNRFELSMLITIRQGKQLRVEEDRHTCGLFSGEQWQQWIAGAGLTLLPTPKNRGPFDLFVAKRPE